MSEMMHAVRMSRPGGPEVLEYVEVPRPEVRDSWSLVQVYGFGINHSEVFTREGKSPSVQFPRILGIAQLVLAKAWRLTQRLSTKSAGPASQPSKAFRSWFRKVLASIWKRCF